jgi:hypothetical protein
MHQPHLFLDVHCTRLWGPQYHANTEPLSVWATTTCSSTVYHASARPHLLLAPLLLPRQQRPSHSSTRQSRGHSCRQLGCAQHQAPVIDNSKKQQQQGDVKHVTAKVGVTLVVSLGARSIGLLQQVDQATAAKNGSSRMVSEQSDSEAVFAQSYRQHAWVQHPAPASSTARSSSSSRCSRIVSSSLPATFV